MTRDLDARRRAIEEAGDSFAVEASAGTGKTSILVRRILNLALRAGPEGPPISLSRICAITFTEKAAGEMKVRLRQELEGAVAAGGESVRRARQALRDLEAASISTFHSFAVSLLKERPIEAGLDPRFVALDENQARLFFAETWEAWLGQKLTERHPILESALRGGLDLESLRGTALLLCGHAHEVRRLLLPAPPSDEDLRRQAIEALDTARNLHRLAIDPGDKLLKALERAMEWLECGNDRPAKAGNVGSAKNWKNGTSDVQRVREFIADVSRIHEQSAGVPKQRITDSVVRWLIGDFQGCWEKRKRAQGLLDFNDQLAAARDLLASSRAARREFQKRYSALLVDEFQDTDPVQLDLVLLLTSTDLDERDPARMRPAPGRLFIVGDPKQSIYRFRGADIETYLEATAEERRARLGLQGLELTLNFRSVPSILRFVDAVFSKVMTRQHSYQPAYLPFGGLGSRSEGPVLPAVRFFGERDEEGRPSGSGTEHREIEAARIARLIARMSGDAGWMVQDRGAVKSAWRRPAYGDIAILMPVLTHVDLMEEALRTAAVPYVLEGGKYYYSRSEVDSAITVLRGISNPNDPVALYGSLRSIFFGLSDEDLLRARSQDLPMDYRAEVPASSPLGHPYAILRDLHARRHERAPSETLEALLMATGAREVLAVRGMQSLANLAKLVRTVRALQKGRTLLHVVDLLASMEEEEVREAESRLMEERSDAVRILSIHRAKGLDFPIVIVAGLGGGIRRSYPQFIADNHGSGTFGLRVPSASEFATAGFDGLLQGEKERDAAERIRLLYVALTRARDHLLISTYHKGSDAAGSGGGKSGLTGTRLETFAGFFEERLVAEPDLASWIDADPQEPGIPAAEEKRGVTLPDWKAILHRDSADLQRLVASTPSARPGGVPPSRERETVAEGADPASARSRAVRLGIAFHRVMERLELGDAGERPALIEEAAAEQSLEPASAALLGEMVRGCLGSPLMERARRAISAGGRVLREVPYVRPCPADGSVDEGKIDLLIEEADGWVLVDYKTDAVPAGRDARVHFTEAHSSQVRQYANALAQVGVKVKAACLLLARTGQEVGIALE